jgi:hypothetical protein
MELTAKHAKFLAALTAGQTVTQACATSGLNRRTAYDHREQDAEFALAWDDAIESSVDELEAEVRRRALDPEAKNSHLLLMFMLKKFRPEYREAYKTEVAMTVERVAEFQFTDQERKQAIEVLRAAESPKALPAPLDLEV